MLKNQFYSMRSLWYFKFRLFIFAFFCLTIQFVWAENIDTHLSPSLSHYFLTQTHTHTHTHGHNNTHSTSPSDLYHNTYDRHDSRSAGILESDERKKFGSDGARGYDGMRGSNGNSGKSQTIKAEGQRVELEISGGPADRGGDGYEGGDASSCNQPSPGPYHVYGASGGDAGKGGAGGSGGSGGVTTIHYTDINHLKNIYIRALGGRGASGGQGNRAGRGCMCTISTWTYAVCQWMYDSAGAYREICEQKTFSCTSGRDGLSSSGGSHGDDGSLGRIRLIEGFDPLPKTKSYVSTKLGAIVREEVILSDHNWLDKRGALSLLAPGSMLSDYYEVYDQTLYRRFRFIWAADYPLEEFANVSIELFFHKDKISFSLGSVPFFYVSEEKTESDLTTFTIQDMVREEDSEKLVFKGIKGKGDQMVLVIEDEGGFAHKFQTNFHLNYETRFMIYRKGFNGKVPEEAISREGNTYYIHAWKLGMDDKFLKAKRKIKIKLSASRFYRGKNVASNDFDERTFIIEK